MKFAVIIPYYQREAGILRRALESITQQRLPAEDSMTTFVVNDQSPQRPDKEIDIDFPPYIRINIIDRPNGGPGAARNTGLAAVDDSYDFVAFLDSDDIWTPEHLARAREALSKGDAEFYFDDHYDSDDCRQSHKTYFQLISMPWGDEQLSSWCPDVFVIRRAAAAFAKVYLAQTSTVVIRRSLGDIRYDELLRSAGEDHLYSFDLARRARRTVYSPQVGAHKGHGINIFSSAINAGGQAYLRLLRDRLSGLTLMQSRVQPGTDLWQIFSNQIAECEAHFWRHWVSGCISRGNLCWGDVHTAAAQHPGLWRRLPRALLHRPSAM